MSTADIFMVQIEQDWKDLVSDIIVDPAFKLMYVLGAVDRGKTTFCRYCAEKLGREYLTAYIDSDPGQSSIGPPATMGLTQIADRGHGDTFTVFSFVGSLSPQGHMIQSLSGIKKLAEKAVHRGCTAIIIDSPGYALGNAAREFQFNVIDLVRPGYLVAFQQGEEMEEILLNFTGSERMKIYRMPVSRWVEHRSPMKRITYRTSRFRQYFSKAEYREFGISAAGLHGMVPDLSRPETLENLLVALCDHENFMSAMGIVRSFRLEDQVLSILAPPFDPSAVSSVQFGSIYVDPRDFSTRRRLHRL